MKKLVCMLATFAILALSGCSPEAKPNQPPPTSTTTAAMTPATVAEDDNYIYYHRLTEQKSFYERKSIKLPLINGIRPGITLFGNNQIAYTNATNSPKPDESNFCELGMYDLKTNQYTPIVTLDDGHSIGGIEAASDNYVVWKESLAGNTWLKSCLHLYDKKRGQDVVIYTNAVDPDTGFVYAENYNPAILLNDVIYFDDVVGVLDNGALTMNVFSYDIASGTIELVHSIAKMPMVYRGELVFLAKEAGTNRSQLLSYANGVKKAIAALDDDIVALFASGQHILTVKNIYENGDPRYSSATRLYLNGIALVDGKPTNYTFHPRANGHHVIWEQMNPGKPIYYDIKRDKFVKLTNEPDNYYGAYLTEDALFFVSAEDENDEFTCLVIPTL